MRGNLEPDLTGQVVAVEAESGEYLVGETVLEAAKQARVKHLNKVFYFFRIGFPAVYVWR